MCQPSLIDSPWRPGATGNTLREPAFRHDAGVGTTAVLDREMYSEAEAARLLRVPQSTLHYWLEGLERGAKRYPPVIRGGPTGGRSVTWGEFVEAGLLRQYRREHQVKLSELRGFIDAMRERFGIPYPLAHQRPYVGEGRHLLSELQDEAELDGELRLVVYAGGQLLLSATADAFYARVEWDDDVAVAWRPHDDPGSPVRMRPARRWGLPAVRGIKTAVLWEQIEAGADFHEVAEDFDLDVGDVRWAWAYEDSARSSVA
jgi:uncharacterized protein (DUF433 family)